MEKRKILIVTKTYPSISTKYKETVCTAGVLLSDDELPLQWIRIYPIRFRTLSFDKQYPRWSVISANIERNDKDYRTESYRIDDTSISVIRKIGTDNLWEERKSFVLPLQFRSTQQLQEQDKSLGIIKPQNIKKYFHKKTERQWKKSQQYVQDQFDLFEDQVDLEKIPYKFFYEFTDEDQKSHKYSISDWEIGQLYRGCRERSKYSSINQRETDALQKVKQKLEDFAINKDLHFIIGNLKQHKNSFMIIGLFYPPKPDDVQLSLF